MTKSHYNEQSLLIVTTLSEIIIYPIFSIAFIPRDLRVTCEKKKYIKYSDGNL